MHVVMVSGHACIRVHKMTIPLVQKGYKVHLLSNKMPPGVAQYYYSFAACIGLPQYLDTIDAYAKTADVFHCHNEPSWFVTAIKERCDVPVILDVHDSYAARLTPEEEDALIDPEKGKTAFRNTTEERTNFQLADALIFPGKVFADLVCKEYNLTQPRLILPSYVPRNFYQYNGSGWLGGLVYEGRVDLPNETKGQATGFKYDDYLDLAKECHRIGLDFHIYSTRKDEPFVTAYRDFCIGHPPRPFDTLMQGIQRHDWGLIGNLHRTAEWDIAFPNKMFEYIAASVPVVAINATAAADFLLEHGIGIKVDSVQELADRWKEHTEVRKTLIRKRQQFTMEAHIQELEDFYREVIDHAR